MSQDPRDAELWRIQRDLTDLQALVRVISEVNSSRDLQQILQVSLEGIRQAVGGEFGGVVLIRSNDKAELARSTALPSALLARLENMTLDASSLHAVPSGMSVSPLALVGQHVSDALRAGGVGFVTLPLSVRGEPIGLLFVGAPTNHMLNPPSVNLLMSIGEQVGRAIENARLHTELRESEEWHRTFIENSGAVFWGGDTEGKILFVNDAACRMIGLERDAILRMRVEDFFVYDEETRRAADKALREKGIWSTHHLHLRTADGRIRVVGATSRAVRDREGKYVGYQAVIYDVTERERLLEALGQRNQELAVLNAIADILSHPLKIPHVLDQVCEKIALITCMETVGLYLADEAQQHLHLLAHQGISDNLLAQVRRLGLDDPTLHRIAVEGNPIALDDLATAAEPGLVGPRAEGYRAGIGVPIQRHGVSIGAIVVGSKTQTRYDQADVGLLLSIGSQVGVALENAELYAQMQRRVNELNGLAEMSAACVATLDPHALSELAVEWTRKLLRADGCGIRLLDGQALRLGAVRLADVGGRAEQLIADDPTLGFIVQHRTVYAVDDVTTDPSILPVQRQRFDASGTRSAIGVPLLVRDRVIGILSVGKAQPHHWSDEEIALLKTIANQVANALNNAQLFQNVLSEQRKVQAIFDSGLSGLFATDVAGNIVMFNRAAERITGYTFAEVCGQKWVTLFSDTAAGQPMESIVEAALSRKQTMFEQTKRFIRTKDGRVIPAAKAAAPLVDDQDNVTGAVGAFWDLTREHAAELSRERFLQTVAHELRNPLTGLLGALQLLERPKISEQARAEMWAVIRSDGVRLRKFANEFLEHEASMESARTLRLEPLPIVSIAREHVRTCQTADKGGHRFRVQAAQPGLCVYADRSCLEHVLGNLLDNAIYYSPPGSLIAMQIKTGTDNLVDIAVRDHGMGIPVSEQQNIFKPFHRVSSQGQKPVYGHGLGLSIAQTMVKEMGGDIWVESKPGHGATFHFTLRRYQ